MTNRELLTLDNACHNLLDAGLPYRAAWAIDRTSKKISGDVESARAQLRQAYEDHSEEVEEGERELIDEAAYRSFEESFLEEDAGAVPVHTIPEKHMGGHAIEPARFAGASRLFDLDDTLPTKKATLTRGNILSAYNVAMALGQRPMTVRGVYVVARAIENLEELAIETQDRVDSIREEFKQEPAGEDEEPTIEDEEAHDAARTEYLDGKASVAVQPFALDTLDEADQSDKPVTPRIMSILEFLIAYDEEA